MFVLQMVVTPTQHAWPSKPFHAARIKATPMTTKLMAGEQPIKRAKKTPQCHNATPPEIRALLIRVLTAITR